MKSERDDNFKPWLIGFSIAGLFAFGVIYYEAIGLIAVCMFGGIGCL